MVKASYHMTLRSTKHNAILHRLLICQVYAQEKDAILTENRRLLEKAQRERETVHEELLHAQRSAEAARAELADARAESEQLASAVQRAESAIDALEKEHNRFVKQASDLCGQKDNDIAVRATAPLLAGLRFT